MVEHQHPISVQIEIDNFRDACPARVLRARTQMAKDKTLKPTKNCSQIIAMSDLRVFQNFFNNIIGISKTYSVIFVEKGNFF